MISKLRSEKIYIVDDFMQIWITKSRSSMFTADSNKYGTLLSNIRNWLNEERITHKQTCNSSISKHAILNVRY
jgi:hypothetical protein